MRSKPGEESRRSARVATTFLVAVDGLDEQYVSRRGDISATGVYFVSHVAVGAVGTVQFLRIASSNRAREIRVMAHVVRAVTVDDVGGLRAHGVALEFMPESEEAALSLERFVQYVLLVVDEPGAAATTLAPAGGSPRDEPRLSPRLAAMALAEARSDDSAVIRELSVRSMTLEANWAVQLGEHLRVDIVAPGMSRRVRLEGSAVRVTPLGPSRTTPPIRSRSSSSPRSSDRPAAPR